MLDKYRFCFVRILFRASELHLNQNNVLPITVRIMQQALLEYNTGKTFAKRDTHNKQDTLM
jgi:hypothetical protein